MADIAATIPLSRKYLAHDKSFDRIELRAPVYKDFVELGNIQELQPGPNKSTMVMTYHQVFAAYVDRLCVSPGAECLSELSIKDTRALFDAVTGFFSEGKTSTGSRNSSSSDAGSEPGTSTE